MNVIRHFLLISLICLILPSCIEGGLLDFSPTTDIVLSNNTAQTFSVQITVSGDTPLVEGRDFSQFTDTLAPYQTLKLLELERNKGFSADKTYTFDIQLSNQAGEHFTLQQHIKGTKNNSDIRFGVYAEDLELALFNDRTLRRFSTGFNQAETQPSEIAFQAKAKARYDDIYYAITPAITTTTLNENPDQLNLLTYNLSALPLISTDIEKRLKAIPAYIQDYDVLLFQEAFSEHREDFILEIAKTYPYQTQMLDKEGINVHDGGVIIFSRFPILNEAQFIFPDCADADCLADKGVNYAAINKLGRVYHVFATHTASFDSAVARHFRQKQFQQMRDFASSLAIPNTETVIYGGDLNVNKLIFLDDYQQMLNTLEADEPNFTGYTAATFDPRINLLAQDPITGGKVEYLDYILVSHAHKLASSNTNTVQVPRSSSADLWRVWDLSDHFPVQGFIE
ncbi:MAG: sphingomyelin phosphodiesterase [Pseudomonadales bacterium]|nr:sphingomyelin phosphodiesterase [Pseudomonadales bacterium]